METRDQWYKPNLLYNIHWRPPKTQEPPKMVVKTVRFNPSVCTCGEHNCGPHYRMERQVVWISKDTTNTAEDTKKGERDSWKGLQSDQEVESNGSEVLHSTEANISDTNDKERCTDEEIYNREITKEGFSVGYGKGLEEDDNRKYGKSKDASEIGGLKNRGSESGGGDDEFSIKKEWRGNGNKDSYDGSEEDDLDINDGMERKEESDSVESDGLKKEHREVRENELNDNHKVNGTTNEKGKCSGGGYFITTGGSMKSESDGESGGVSIKERLTNIGVENYGVNGESNGIEVKMDNFDNKSDGEIVGEDFKSDFERNNRQYNYSLNIEDNVRNDDRCNGKANNGERYVNNSLGLEEDVTEEGFLDEQISPAFGIMSIYCRSELHYNVLRSCA